MEDLPGKIGFHPRLLFLMSVLFKAADYLEEALTILTKLTGAILSVEARFGDGCPGDDKAFRWMGSKDLFVSGKSFLC